MNTMPRRAVGLLLTALLMLLPAVPRADEKKKADPPAPAGTWKVFLPSLRGAGVEPIWLVKIARDGDSWSGEVLSTRDKWPKAKLDKVRVAADTVRFEVKTAELPALVCELALPKDKKATKLRGSYLLGRKPQPIELERSSLPSLDVAELLKERLAATEDGAEAAMLAFALLSEAEANKASAADVKAWADKAVRSGALYGKGWQREVLLTVAQLLAAQKGHEALALGYARKAEALLTAKDSVGEQREVLTTLADVLEKAGQGAEAKKLRDRADKLDVRVKVTPFAGRKAKSSRVVLVELFTNAQLARCAANDLALDALGRAFKPSEVVLLQYHVNINRPEVRSDPLAGAAGEARAEFYDRAVQGIPTVIFNGKAGPPGGGGLDDAADKYDEYAKALAPLLEAPPKAELKLTAARKGDKITIAANVTKLDEAGDDVRLRVALVEREVRYKGQGGLTRYGQVVRDMPGGDAGVVLKKAGPHSFTVDVAALRKKLNEQLDKRGQLVPFPDKSRPVELKALRVVAFVQNDKTGEVLQAAQAEVAAAKEDKKDVKKAKGAKGEKPG